MMTRSITLYSLGTFRLLQSCGGKTETDSQREEIQEESTVVSLTAEQMKAAGVALGSVEMKNLTTALSVRGTLEVPKQNKALVTYLANGV